MKGEDAEFVWAGEPKKPSSSTLLVAAGLLQNQLLDSCCKTVAAMLLYELQATAACAPAAAPAAALPRQLLPPRASPPAGCAALCAPLPVDLKLNRCRFLQLVQSLGILAAEAHTEFSLTFETDRITMSACDQLTMSQLSSK